MNDRPRKPERIVAVLPNGIRVSLSEIFPALWMHLDPGDAGVPQYWAWFDDHYEVWPTAAEGIVIEDGLHISNQTQD